MAAVTEAGEGLFCDGTTKSAMTVAFADDPTFAQKETPVNTLASTQYCMMDGFTPTLISTPTPNAVGVGGILAAVPLYSPKNAVLAAPMPAVLKILNMLSVASTPAGPRSLNAYQAGPANVASVEPVVIVSKSSMNASAGVFMSTREAVPSQTLGPIATVPPEPPEGLVPPALVPATPVVPALVLLPLPPALVPALLPVPPVVAPVPALASGRGASELEQAALAAAPATSTETRIVFCRFKIRIFTPSVVSKHHGQASRPAKAAHARTPDKN